jgi:hypothetical protein
MNAGGQEIERHDGQGGEQGFNENLSPRSNVRRFSAMDAVQ